MTNKALFFATMRHPQMRLLRQALRHLSIERGVDWRAITSMEAMRYGHNDDCWMLLTDHHLVCSLEATNPRHTFSDFLSFRLHDDNDPCCECEECREARICHVQLKDYYIAQEARRAQETCV